MLTDMQIRKAQPADKAYKLADGGGLYLFVSPSGGRSFRLKYRFQGREKTLTFGLWPAVSLAEARRRQAEAKAALAAGRDPSIDKRKAAVVARLASGDTFAALAVEWHAKQRTRWGERQHRRFMASLEADAFPHIGALPLAEIDAPMVLAVLNAVVARGAREEAHRLRRRIEAVFAYGIATGRAKTNPALQLKGALPPVLRTSKQPAVLEAGAAREAYQALIAYPAQPETRAAMQMVALTATRPSNVRHMEWSEIEGLDGDAATWRIPGAKLKGTVAQKAQRGREHVMPLSSAAVAVLRAIRPLTGHARYCFPSPRFPDRPLSDMALSVLCQRAGLGGRHVPHGWRASFSTIMNERDETRRQAIDAALGHVVGGTEGSYNRAGYLAQRRALMEEWAAVLSPPA